jgi:hypothetical protein
LAEARATLGNERVSIDGGSGSIGLGPEQLSALLGKYSGPLMAARLRRAGEVFAEIHTLRPLDLRVAGRALTGAETGPAANVTKLLKAESSERLTALALELAGPAAVAGDASEVVHDYLFSRCLTVAGCTSEIMRNTIADRIIGMPRGPLARYHSAKRLRDEVLLGSNCSRGAGRDGRYEALPVRRRAAFDTN